MGGKEDSGEKKTKKSHGQAMPSESGAKRKRDEGDDGVKAVGGEKGKGSDKGKGNFKVKDGKAGKATGSKHPMRENRGKQQQHGYVSHDSDTICLCCRQRGHTMAMCPKNPNKAGAQGGQGASKKPKLTCFNCGEAGHNLKKCPKPLVNGGLKFAVCFVCKEQGHISAKCPKNTHGIYPKGGSCKICGDVWHLAKDCPEKGTAKDKKAAAPAAAAAKGISKHAGTVEDLDGNAEFDFKGKGSGVAEVTDARKGPEGKKKAKVVKF